MWRYLCVFLLLFVITGCQQAQTPASLIQITINPSSKTVLLGSSEAFSATGTYSDNSSQAITPEWSVSGEVGTISLAGIFTSTKSAIGKVIASKDGITAYSNVTVTSDATQINSAPSSPTGLSTASITTSSVLISWNPVSDATKYILSYGVDSSATNCGTIDASSNISKTLMSLNSNTTYYVKVMAVNSIGTSSYSSPVSFKTMTPTTPANIALKGSINKRQDSFGWADFYGEVENMGSQNASFVEITITMKDSAGNVIDTDSSYVVGTVLTISGSETNTCLKANDTGAFHVSTTKNYSDIASYTYDIDWETYDTATPKASLDINGTVNATYNDYLGYKEYLGEIKNNGSTNTTFNEIYFVSKDNLGKVIDISSSYVTGTDINAGDTKSFDVTTSVSSTDVSSYYYKFDWSE
ncbi:hypothetical protein A3J90_02580 [candidate division WOR-1 bacterium RIFOXYC2_FULL_37_10]|uniref:Fibronectin type-III domain-containing protein n=1 Tax=candidate division WOR-1 bacterium RIFOXYB2_FULL_37_13 TaxID=1802579 RepID=A0A1F4SEC8_UNCSA|nr:MAG: hypothetical protein A2246_03540 [candidate division WOR-1 bacterium RIFOXYA2_FULL_37_7]OGC18788.1 MAG: hypothetical protein A2310_00590 [candidate division WOR-1 bacterium RIFOXYB2_FULL_37_13]OGC33989.1 MAG: hypothetical protein A3J90_02580 [candidate division WOR-1 bacterium RIFOXYC2_FULL_37_10]